MTMTKLLTWIGVGFIVYVGALLLAVLAAFLDVKAAIVVMAVALLAVKIVLMTAALVWIIRLLFKLAEWVDEKTE